MFPPDIRELAKRMARAALAYWKALTVFLVPLLLAPLPVIAGTSEAKCGYVILVMACFYLSNAIPLAVTALIPAVAYPMLDIMSTNEVCEKYFTGTVMMFFGGLAVAVAVEHCNLHRRIALFVILRIGQSRRRLMVGFMATTMFLSMWISNTAATAMMTPIVQAVLKELLKENEVEEKTEIDPEVQIRSSVYKLPYKSDSTMQIMDHQSVEMSISHNTENGTKTSPKPTKEAVVANMTTEYIDPQLLKSDTATMFMLGVAYSSNVGGTGFPTGTGPNLVLWGLLADSYPSQNDVNFATWMAFNVPIMLVCTLVTGLTLDCLYVGWGRWRKLMPTPPARQRALRGVIQRSYDALGPVTWHEGAVAACFSSLVLLWVFRKPGFVPGWVDIMGNEAQIGNATPAIFIVVLMFAIPAQFKFWPSQESEVGRSPPGLLTWGAVEAKMPWGLVLLMGGGFAMAAGAGRSGLSAWLGGCLQGLGGLPTWLLVLVVMTTACLLTEVVSNITSANIFLPVVKDLAVGLGVNPLLLLLPTAVACSYAVMTPVANPPNAIVANACQMDTREMLRAGVYVKVLSLAVLFAGLYTLGGPVFGVFDQPAWANATITAV